MINTTKIAKNNLKHNKSKSILIIITIILSTTLLSAVGMTCLDWNVANKENIRSYSGTHHGVYGSIDEKGIEEIKTHSEIDKVGVINGIGKKEYDDKLIIALSFADEVSTSLNNILLKEGNLPKAKNEIALDGFALDKLGYEKKLGQKIELEYEDYKSKEPIKSEFILSGILENKEASEIRKVYTGMVSYDYMVSTRDMSKENFNVFFTFKDIKGLQAYEIIEKVEKIGEDFGIKKNAIKANKDYLNTLSPDMEVITWGAVICAIIILSSILVIYNIFYLSIVTKVQEFGKLRAIGATKSQIKSIVLKEGMILSLIAIPVGVIVGYVINEFILKKIFFSFVDTSKLSIAIVIMLISVIAVFVSLLRPMSIASKVSVIDALRYSGSEDSNDKPRKGYENVGLKELSRANLKRNKKRTYVTLISLSLSGIIFVVASSALQSMDPEKFAKNHFPYDMNIRLDNYTFGDEESLNTELNMIQINTPLSEEFINEIKNMDGVDKIEISNYAKSEIKNHKTEYKYNDLSGVDEYDLDDLERYLIDGKIDLEKLKSGEEIIITYSDLAQEIGVSVGDKITLTLYDGNKKIDKEFKIQAIGDGPGTLGIHQEAFAKLFKNSTVSSVGIYADPNYYEELKTKITDIANSNEYLESNNIDEELEMAKFSIGTTNAMGYSLVIIIGIIGFMNLINSMISSIITRKKELGMLQAIGLTDKQLIKMLNMEAMFYTSTMMISSLTLGTGIGYIAVQMIRKMGASYASYEFPIFQILMMIVSIVVAQLVLIRLISKNFNKESLIDRVRYSE